MANVPDPITRTEMYYNYLTTWEGIIPDPVTRQDQYLYYLCVNGGIGGNVTPEQIQQAVDNYLDENPVSSGKLSVENHILKLVPGGGTDENT